MISRNLSTPEARAFWEEDAASQFSTASPRYTVAEEKQIAEAIDVLQRAWEAGHFSELDCEGGLSSAARHHHAAVKAQALIDDDDDLVVVSRQTATGRRFLVGLKGRTA